MATKTNHILIGLGGTGGKILRAFKMRMFEEFPDKKERESQSVALLYVDSTREMMGIGRPDMDVMGQDASFGENEFLFIKGCDVPDLLDNINMHPELKGIVNNVGSVRTAIGNLGEAAGQKRRAGRLLFAVNARKYVDALKNCFARCNEKSHNNSKEIHIFAGLCGGTGSGSIIDAIVQARNIPGWEEAKINVYAMIPEQDLPKADMDKGRYYENGYAALAELNALQCGLYKPSDVLGNGAPLNLFSEKIKGVANGIALYSNVNSNGCLVDSFTELPKIVSDYVYSRIFLINPDADECHDILRAFNFENMDGFELENDEKVLPDELWETKEISKVRTKKIYSFGLKRVIYPERRVLKHMTYSVGQNVLYQFKYNNWRSSLGFINEEANQDYRAEYLNADTLSRWMLDEAHLTLEEEILKRKGEAYKSFADEWDARVKDFAEFCAESEYPLADLSKQMNGMFDSNFRDEGVANYYATKKRSLSAICKEIRSTIEKELFNKWRDGQISIIELSKIGELLANYVSDDLKTKLDESYNSIKNNITESDGVLSDITYDWTNVGFLGNVIMRKKKDHYVQYQDELAYNLEMKTRKAGIEFAKSLVSELQREIGNMSDEINSFSKMLEDAIDETNRLITAQQKVNKGLEDMRGATIEVSEEERMAQCEENIRLDKELMNNISRQIREEILPEVEFTNFGDLLSRVSVHTIKRAFDVKLSEIIQAKHADMPKSEKRVLGLNILTQLQQKLGNNRQKIQEFAREILTQSGAYINLDRNQIIANIRNNDQPDENKNTNLREVLISIPSPEDNPGLIEFANDLREAFRSQVENGVKAPRIFMKSSRKNELSIITINYAFPMRAISWLSGYKKRYQRFVNTGNVNDDLNHKILVHGEGLGDDLQDIFAVPDAELAKLDEERMKSRIPQAPGVATPPPVFPTPSAEPEVQMFFNIAGTNYGPYDYATCKQLKQNKQINEKTLAWQQGMAAWAPAGEVKELSALFMPEMPAMPGMPPLPGAPGMPPMPPTL